MEAAELITLSYLKSIRPRAMVILCLEHSVIMTHSKNYLKQ